MILAHSELEAMYAYLGMVLQGEMIQALFTGLRPLVFLLLVIGIVWAIGSMMVRGRAQSILLYLVLAVASLVLLKQTMVADSQALITGNSGSSIAQANTGARVNTIFFAVVRAYDAVLSSLMKILDRGFGKNVAFETAPFASTRGMMWAMAQTMDDAETIREAGKFLNQCLAPAETRLQNSNQKGSISGIFGGLGDLVNRPDDPAAANTRAALQEIVPVDGPATCLEWANQIKSRFGTWLDGRRTLLTEKLPQMSDEQVNEVLTLALFTSATQALQQLSGSRRWAGIGSRDLGTRQLMGLFEGNIFEQASQWLGGATGIVAQPLGWRHRGFRSWIHADDRTDDSRLVDHASLRILPVRCHHQSSSRNACSSDRLSRGDLVGEKLDAVSRVDQPLARSAIRCQRRIYA